MGMRNLFRDWQNSGNGKTRTRRRMELTKVEPLEVRRMLTANLVGSTVQVVALSSSPISLTNSPAGLDVVVDGTASHFAPGFTKINVVSGASTTAIAVNGNYTGLAVQITGSGTGNTLTSTTQVNIWSITGPNSGTLNGNIQFTNIQNLVGGVFDDDFQFGLNGYVDGSVNGGSGVDTLDYGSYGAGVVVNLNVNSATSIGSGFSNISNMIGSQFSTDLLIGADTDNVWTISSGDSGNVNGQFDFSSVKNLTGGAGNDQFVFQPTGFVDGMVIGGGGNDALDYSQLSTEVLTNLLSGSSTDIGSGFTQITSLVGNQNSNNLLIGSSDDSNWQITSANAGSVFDLTTSVITNFSGYQNLFGGTGNDTFMFMQHTVAGGGVITGYVDGQLSGGAGANTIDYSVLGFPVVVNLSSHSATQIGREFSGIQNFVGTTGSTNTLIGENLVTDWNISGPNSGNLTNALSTVSFSSFQNLTGGKQNDTFHFFPLGYVDGVLYGGQGSNILDYSVRTLGVVVNLQASSATSIGGGFLSINGMVGSPDPGPDPINDANTLIGADTLNHWMIGGPDSGQINNFTFSNVQNLVGGKGPDVFSILPGGIIFGSITGGQTPADGRADWLDYSAMTADVIVNLAKGTASDIQKVINVNNVHGSNGSNILTGNANGNVLVGGLSSDTITGGSGRSLLIGALGTDTLVGGAGQDIVIGSQTDYDNNLPALSSILAEWQSPTPLSTRIANLRKGGGLNGTNTLVADVNVHNDLSPDAIYGGVGPNWLWGQPTELKDKTAQDIFDTPIANTPIIAGTSTSVFTAGSDPSLVSSGILIIDPTSKTIASATVKITGNYKPSEDLLGFSSSTVTGNIVGSFNVTTGTMTLTSLGATATVAQFQTALQNIVYFDTSSTPSLAPRTISYQVNDGLLNSNIATSTVLINTRPVLSGSSSVSYTANQAATTINSVITVSDISSVSQGTLAFATVSISHFYQVGEDVLSFIGDPTTGNIFGSFNANTGVLTLTSSGSRATLSQYQAALRRVTYLDNSATPFLLPRTITFQVSDGFALSNTVISTVNFS